MIFQNNVKSDEPNSKYLKNIIFSDRKRPKWWTCMSKDGQTSYETYEYQFSSCYEHFVEVSLKSDYSHVRYLKSRISWDQIWPDFYQKHAHAQTRLRIHVMQLISLNSFHTKKISWKYDWNVMNLISDILRHGISWDLIWPTMSPNHQHVWARMDNYVIKSITLNSLHTKTVCWKIYRNVMNQIKSIF